MSSVGELISTSRALSSRCSWALSFLDGEQKETGHKQQSGGKLCDFFGKLVLFVCILALLAGCGLGFLEEAFENEVNFKSISFGEHYLLQGYGQELFVAFMGLLNFINVAWWSIACTSTSALGFGDSLHHKLCGGADGALHRQFRGGAGGSSASSGSQSMQDVMQQLSLVVAKLEAGDRPQDEVSRFVAQLATLVSKWQVVTPTRNELKQELQTIMEEVGKSPWSQHIAGARQSFYEQFGGRALQSQVGKEEPKEAKAPTKVKGKSKGATRGKGPPDLPRFDLKRIAPALSSLGRLWLAFWKMETILPMPALLFAIALLRFWSCRSWQQFMRSKLHSFWWLGLAKKRRANNFWMGARQNCCHSCRPGWPPWTKAFPISVVL